MDLQSRVLKYELIKWKELEVLQADSLKEISPDDYNRLKNSILENKFIQPFFVWESDKIYCLDGKHRITVLNDLEASGVEIPELLPAVFIDCFCKKDAAVLVLLFSSNYAKVTQLGFADMLKEYELDFDLMKSALNLPEFNMEAFEAMNINPIDQAFVRLPKDKPAVMRITFASPDQLESAKPYIESVLKDFEGSFLSVSAGEI